MNYWNGNLITSTRREPSATSASGIFNLNSQLIYKQGNTWPSPINVVQTNLNVWLDAAQASSYSGSGSTWADLSGNGNDATLTGTYSLDSSDGGGSIHFNTGRAEMDVYTNSITANGGTLECWVKVVDTSSYRWICGWRDFEPFYMLLLNNNGQVEARVDGGSNTNGQIFATDLGASTWANNWSHVVYTVDPGNTAVYYRNGQSVDSQNHSGTFTNSTNILTLAGTYQGSLQREQKQSVFRYYTKPLTAAEVLNNYNAEKTRHGLS